MIAFRYFLGPTSDMSTLANAPVPCAFCAAVGEGFELDDAICSSLDEGEREGKHGCPECLVAGRFGIEHNTDVGILGAEGLEKVYGYHPDAPPKLRADALEMLLRTPDAARWQYEPWLTHCGDFMAYIGTWQPSEFVRNAPDGDGRAQFMRMTRDVDLQHVWDEACDEGESMPADDWNLSYYAYRCLHCGELAGNWDCD